MSNVPKLRFKEFSGEWEEKYLSELGTFKNGLNKSKEDFGFGYPFVNLMDVFGKDVVFSEKFDLVNANEKDLKLYNLLKGDILFIRSSVKREGVGETILVLDDLENTTYSGFLIRFREKTKYLNLLFKKYCFKTKKFRNSLLSLSTTSANTNINQESLNLLKLNFPSKQEQEKIASFLTSVDTKIEQLTKKEELLQQYKKGVMQKIFNQEIRFKADDGNDFCEWEEKKLGEITYNVSQKNKENLAYPVYSINNKKGFIPQGEQFEGMDSNNRNYDISLYKIIDENTFAYNPARINVGSLGYSGNLKDIIISSLYVCFKTNKDINDKFLLQYFSTFEFNKSVLRNTEGGVRDYLFYENFSNIKTKIPCFEEQTKIVNFLSSIDTKIEQIQKQLELSKEFKKALLQQMFV